MLLVLRNCSAVRAMRPQSGHDLRHLTFPDQTNQARSFGRDLLGAEQSGLQVGVYLLLGLAAEIHRWQAFRPARHSVIRESKERGTITKRVSYRNASIPSMNEASVLNRARCRMPPISVHKSSDPPIKSLSCRCSMIALSCRQQWLSQHTSLAVQKSSCSLPCEKGRGGSPSQAWRRHWPRPRAAQDRG